MGGLRALQIFLPGLPRDFSLPLVVAQHRSKEDDPQLLSLLQKSSLLTVKEVEDKDPVGPGRVYFGPADYHVLVGRNGLNLSKEAPQAHARPSIDALFESAAHVYGTGVVGVLLTGASADGARGLATIKECGGLAIVQEPASAESQKMPTSALIATEPDQILPLDRIAPFLVRLEMGNRLDA